MELFGPDFERYEQVQAEKTKEEEASAVADAPGNAGNPIDKIKSKKGKLAAKSTGQTYQFQIMRTLGIPHSEIKKFADPQYWLNYFPPIAIVSVHPYL